MIPIRQSIGGLGNLMFKQAYLMNEVLEKRLPDVYVQDQKYFKNHAKEIRETFGQGIGQIDKIAIHIRRGDYVDNTFYVNLTETDYYETALTLIESNKKIIVFCRDRQNMDTDISDRQWCIEFMDRFPIDWDFSPYENSETDDLNLMASCKTLIMANSSFSWWAGFLGDTNKTVYCPSYDKWFSDGIQRIGLLDEWIKI